MNKNKHLNSWVICAIAAAMTMVVTSCQHEPFATNTGQTGGTGNNGTGPAGTVCFESDILPIFNSSCARSGCHDAATKSEGYVLDSYSNIVKKGIVAGNAANSKLYTMLFKTGSDRMPPPPNPGLTTAQTTLIAQWINEGAKNTTNCNNAACDTLNVTYQKSVWPIVQNNCVGCHNSSLANGGYNFTTYADLKTAAGNGRLLGSINYLPGFSGMPQGSRLSTCQVATIRKWVQSGALNN